MTIKSTRLYEPILAQVFELWIWKNKQGFIH